MPEILPDAKADAKLHVPVVTLSTKDSENLTKQLNEGFKDLFIGIVMRQNLQQ